MGLVPENVHLVERGAAGIELAPNQDLALVESTGITVELREGHLNRLLTAGGQEDAQGKNVRYGGVAHGVVPIFSHCRSSIRGMLWSATTGERCIMVSLLILGFFIGMRHALEADHVAAVSSLATRSASPRECIAQGVFWGLGHTLTLFLVGSTVLLLDRALPERLASGLELAVGLMLVVLGLDVLRRLAKERVHFHLHEHADGVRHFHGHSHAGESAENAHSHGHWRNLPLRALVVGLVHGMAGSAALIVLTLEGAPSVAAGLLYILLFGVGSIAGMALLSVAIAAPLRYSAAGLTRLHGLLHGAIGLATVAIGIATTIGGSRSFFG
jgi:ABC-type nickel/cobalt efflux system permease component RcnA